MLKKFLLAAAATCVSVLPAQAAVFVVDGIGAVTGISANNNYTSDLAALGLTGLAINYGSVSITGAPGTVSVYRVASESGYHNTLTAFGSAPIAEPGPQPVSGWTPNDLVTSTPSFTGSLAGAINFFSNGIGSATTFNSAQLGIFLPKGFQGGQYVANELWIGFDDSKFSNPFDDHDDFIIRISVVPEPATWLTMIAGFGMVGYQLRRRKSASIASAV